MCYNMRMAKSPRSTDVDDQQPLLPARRKVELAEFVNEKGEVTVAMVAERFGVSSDTARRDLDKLDGEGRLVRTHGGALSVASMPRPDSGLDIRLRLQTREKDAIGSLAAAMIPDGAVVLLNAGTTVLALARHLTKHLDLTIATNNLRFPAEVPPSCLRDLYLFGGAVRTITQATTGPVRIQAGPDRTDIDIRADLALIAVGAVHPTDGYTTSNVGDAVMMAEMAKRSKRVAILADSTKFDHRLFAGVGGLDLADYFITDTAPSGELADALAQQEVEIISPTSAPAPVR